MNTWSDLMVEAEIAYRIERTRQAWSGRRTRRPLPRLPQLRRPATRPPLTELA
ncbi:MAG: hypothetical protein R2731_13675 [Nocardioides sp.]